MNRAIVRPPASNFADGLTTARLGAPDLDTALSQHEKYCAALESCGLVLTRLPADPPYPDSTFVEDAAVLVPRLAVLDETGGGEPQGGSGIDERRAGGVLRGFSGDRAARNPRRRGRLRGGESFLHRDLAPDERGGARQLAEILAETGLASTLVDVRSTAGILHLKSGIAYLGENRLAAIEALAEREELRGFEIVRVPPGEEYAANCVRVNDAFLIPAGFPSIEAKAPRAGLHRPRARDVGVPEDGRRPELPLAPLLNPAAEGLEEKRVATRPTRSTLGG